MIREQHVVPTDDVAEHDTNTQCWCEPEVETLTADDQRVGLVVTHHSVDGRELNERE